MKERFLGALLVFLGACSFGVLSSIVKTAYKSGYSLGQVTGIQTFFGMIILWAIYAIYHLIYKPTVLPPKTIQGNSLWQVCLAGFFPGLVGIFYYQCVQLIPASVAIILLMQYLWISVIVDFLIFKNRPTKNQILTVMMIIFGSLLAAGIFNQNMVINIKGYLFGLLAALTYSLFIITSSRVGNQLPTLKKSALIITGACFITFVIFPPIFLFKLGLNDKLYQMGILLAILGTVLPPFLFSLGIPKVGISLGAILSTAELPVAVIASYFYLKENVNLSQWLGVVCILLAIIVPNFIPHIKQRKV
jgi:drug/metabolite transporter (DMT)-like permease